MNNSPELANSSVYRTLLESTKAIPWKIDWASKQFVYIGPQIEKVLGWSQDSWKTVEDWATRIHNDERERIVNFCIERSLLGEDHEADYRALTKDGDYVWIRDVVHVVRTATGEPEALIGFMFDISERKKTEQQLLALQKQLEEYSYKDGLTEVANRRMFDVVLEQEWLEAKRNQHPLSLVMIDIDFFKQYNDLYGHLQGDEVLKQVAHTLNHAGMRTKDFFARFGGEEFALILPETSEASAIKVAERCRNLIFKAQIPHAASKISQILTISIGVSSIVPLSDHEPKAFVEFVDSLLYEAKNAGRNRTIQASNQY